MSSQQQSNWLPFWELISEKIMEVDIMGNL